MPRHGLIISYYFPPAGGGAVQRWLKLVKHLSSWDWEFTVLSADLEGSYQSDKSLLEQIPDSTKIVRIDNAEPDNLNKKKTSSKFIAKYWLRWLSSFYFIPDSRKKWINTVKRTIKNDISIDAYDVIILTIPPYSVAMLAAEISQSTNTPVTLDFRDPWTTNPYKIHPTPLHLYLDRKYEFKSLRNIKYLISAYTSTINYFCDRLPDLKKQNTAVISNSYDEENFVELDSTALSSNNKFNIAFSGTFYSHLNNPVNLLKAIKSLKSGGIDVAFHHIGNSAYDISKIVKRYGLNDQFYEWGYQTHKECLKILKSMDAYCIILDEKIKNADKTIGGKIYEYLRLKKPILAMVPRNGEAAKLIKKTDSGIVCSSFMVDEIINALKTIISKRKKFTFHGIEEFSSKNQAKKLKLFFEKVI